MALITCRECKAQISDQAAACPQCGCPAESPMSNVQNVARVATFAFHGWEYKSSFTIAGIPLLHITSGFDLETMRPRVSKGIIAIGQIAVGGLALGGISIGVVTLGGISLGLLALGGLAAGGIALGGMAAGYVAL